MSKLLTPRNAAIGAGVVGAVLYVSSKSKAPLDTFASASVADRYSAGGGSKTHLPAVATPRGNPDNVTSPQINPKGIDTEHFKEHQAQQKSNEAGGGAPFGKKTNESVYGHKDGK